MNTFYCCVSVSPILADLSTHSCMISQILYGEKCQILEVNGYFSKIKMDFDGVEGWVYSSVLKVKTDINSTNILQKPFEVVPSNDGELLLSLGSELEGISDLKLSKEEFRENLVKNAKKFINVPYLKGGRTFFGTDSSGFIQVLFKSLGIHLPRFGNQQVEIGLTRDFIMESEPGDVLFYTDLEGNYIDSGLVINPSEVIHTFGKVRQDVFDSTGIYNSDLKKYTHLFQSVKNFI